MLGVALTNECFLFKICMLLNQKLTSSMSTFQISEMFWSLCSVKVFVYQFYMSILAVMLRRFFPMQVAKTGYIFRVNEISDDHLNSFEFKFRKNNREFF